MNTKLKSAVQKFDNATGSKFSRLTLTPHDLRDLAQLCGPKSFDLPELVAIFTEAAKTQTDK